MCEIIALSLTVFRLTLADPRVKENVSDVISFILIFVEHVLHKVNAGFAYS